MKKKLKLYKRRGMTILETVIYISLSAVIICCTLTIMAAMIKRTDEENKSSFRINKLYSTLSTIEKYTSVENAAGVYIKYNTIYFTDKNKNNCSINQQGTTLCLKIGETPLYFMHNEYYDTNLKRFECYIKDKLLYVNLKLETGEMMEKCIYINHL